jgi:ATP-binding cassette, subfamily A (ABC1), member 3
MIQNLLEREIIRHHVSVPDFPRIFVQRYPYPAYVLDILGLVLEFAIPLIFMIAFLYSAINNIKYVALEKELQLKEAMKIMGLPGYLHWIAWFTKCMLFQIIIISIVTIMVTIPFEDGLAVFTHTSWSVLWVFFFLYSLAGVTFSFMFSTLFSKANVAAISGAVAWLFMLQPYSIINRNYNEIGLWPKIGAVKN